MWSRVLLIALAACYQPAKSDRARDAQTAGSDVASADSLTSWLCASPVLVETFAQNGTACPAGWTLGITANASIMQNNALVIRPDPMMSGSSAGCRRNGLTVGSTATVAVEVGDIILASNAWTQLQFYAAGNQWQIKGSGNGVLRLQDNQSQDLGLTVAYKPSYRWWRFRGTTNTLYAEYFDGAAWQQLGTPQAIDVAGAISLEINAGINNATTYSGSGTFDAVVVCP